ncbi:MAG: hypothetical protein IM504_18310 [Microcystis sp. M038S2]|jgi:hypothetical protein|uniref:Uncharacterized protein n=1 Tax=Microcystis aeruginosa G11-04 TaxID=2685956 RepID=A0A966G0M3_MICAE|nr:MULTISPECIES: hypothetical protein [unclassified Microcystis]NCR27462.1 hypothetical protein [Microcystis aeruginosa LE13-04]NCS12041.1 hypothetical protein [Microcystis aeruginosa G13-09]NCS40385.1 hypothetical protein [Microcystis aeruginosa BS13-10]NCS57865.1 hypothetical protein [Microcystis aeruginosa G11-04]TRU61536.1 MAG: hypothetical protein EWV48_11030 [Microcystis aeruginosa Ma_QC_C_20070823_S13]TRU65248.1 MAG: hypothetical protein EWV56_01270 [Microcystis aeruginosa Ma_QC_C_2007
MKISPFLAAIPLLLLGGTSAPSQETIDPQLLTGNLRLTLKNGVWKLWQDQPVYQNLTLDLSCDRSVCQPSVWGYAPKFNKEVDHQGTVKTIKLDNAWRLQVKMNIQTHPWQAEVREAIYNIEIVPYQDQLIGSYQGTLGGRRLQNTVNGTISPLWPNPVPNHQPLQPREHPRLIFRKSELTNLREKAKTPIGQTIIAQLNNSLQQKIYYDGYVPNGGYHATGHCFLAILNQDRKSAETAWEILEKTRKNRGRRVLEQSPIVAGVALAYDLCYDFWGEKRQREITGWLFSESKKLLKGGSPKDGWNGEAVSNWNARARGAAGLASLAILKEDVPPDPLYYPSAQVEMAKRHIERYFTTAIGDRGFGTEGDLYSTEPMVIAVFPFLQGYRNSLGLDLVTGSSAAQLIPHYLTRIVPKNGQLLIPAYGRHQMFVGVSLLTAGLGITDKSLIPAIKWRLQGQEKQLFHPHYPHIAPFLLAAYPSNLIPENPERQLSRVLVDQQKGFYAFRNRWQNEEDFVASIYLKQQPFVGGWSFPDVASVRIWGLGGHWASFERSKGDWNSENTLTFPKTPPWRQAKPISFQSSPDGSGVITLKTDKIRVKGADTRAGVALVRSFAVDYSLSSGSPGLFVLMDKLLGKVDQPEFINKTWVMNTQGNVTLGKNSFTITQNRANMQGTFITPVTLKVEKTNTGERILATGSEEFFLVMTVQKSRPPAVKIIGKGLDAIVQIGSQEISIIDGAVRLKEMNFQE